jgi:hypothetical protein
MKLSPGEQESIVSLLTRIYVDICDMETQFRLFTGDGDFRPRIEYFHDAVRAFTNNDSKDREKGGRLAIEFLAYDLSCLRYLQSMPLSPFKPHAANLSPSTEMIKLDQHLMPTAVKPNRVEKERISELYQRYAVLFSALLKPLADNDYKERTDGMNQDVESIHTITHGLDDQIKDAQLAEIINHINDDELRMELMALVKAQKFRKKDDIVQLLKDKIKKKNKDIKHVESAHLQYAMAQLAIYEESKDMVKKMAQQGMNLVGKFVESSIADTKREMGR